MYSLVMVTESPPPAADHLGRVHPPVGVDHDDVARLQGRAHRLVVRALPPALGRRLEGPALFGKCVALCQFLKIRKRES